jgi:hypothetical protein
MQGSSPEESYAEESYAQKKIEGTDEQKKEKTNVA